MDGSSAPKYHINTNWKQESVNRKENRNQKRKKEKEKKKGKENWKQKTKNIVHHLKSGEWFKCTKHNIT